MSTSSQLAAILTTEIVGTGSGNDDVQAVEVKSRQIQTPCLEKYNGKELQNEEHHVSAYFISTIDAVNCAREIQSAVNLQPTFELNINIHLGEVSVNGQVSSISNFSRSSQSSNRPGVFISEEIFNTIKNNELINVDGHKQGNLKDQEVAEEISMDDALIRQLESIVDENIGNQQFSVEDLSDAVAKSRSHLHRKLHNLTGQSISQFIRTRRLQKALDLLKKEVGTISEIAFKVGFGSSTYFTKCFHEHYGYPPGEVKKRMTNIAGVNANIEAEFKEESIDINDVESVRLFKVTDNWKRDIGRRKLAAIMFTDVVGFSALMNSDEAKGLKILDQNRALHKKSIEDHNGTWVKEMGDGVMCYFESAIDAVTCAVDIQEKAATQEFDLRIGIHLGDIVFQDEDVFGEGVNIASRLLPLGEAGSIVISEKIYDEIENKSNFSSQFLGSFHLKNIQRPVGIHAISNPGIIVPDPLELQQKASPSELDGNQPLTAQIIIRELFEKLAEVKPSLGKYLIIDEDDDEEIDTRLLAYQIIKNFPWPIGVELRRLFSGDLRSPNLGRLLQLNKTIDRSLKFVAYLLICEIHDLIQKRSMSLEESVRKVVGKSLSSLEDSSLVNLVENLLELLQSHKEAIFVEELPNSIHVDEGIKSWATNRKDILESGPMFSVDELAEQCSKYETILLDLLRQLSFLVKYKLVNIGDIKVIKPKYKEASYEHSINILNSTDSDFRKMEEEFEKFADSNSVLLVKNLKEPSRFLNLSPLIVDTHSDSRSVQGNMPLKKDIFLFLGETNGALSYLGTETTQRADLSKYKFYENLQSSLMDLKEAFEI